MIKWIHPTLGTFDMFVNDPKKVTDEQWEQTFDVFAEKISSVTFLVVVNEAGNQCLFTGDIIKQGYMELVQGEDNG